MCVIRDTTNAFTLIETLKCRRKKESSTKTNVESVNDGKLIQPHPSRNNGQEERFAKDDYNFLRLGDKLLTSTPSGRPGVYVNSKGFPK